MNAQVQQEAQEFMKTHAYALDTVHRRVSFGKNAGDSFLLLGKNAPRFPIEIVNNQDSAVTLIMSASRNIFAHDADRLKTLIGGSNEALVIVDGIISSKMVDGAAKTVKVTAKEAGRKFNDLREYLNDAPSQIFGIQFESSDLEGNPKTQNYNQTVKFLYADPFSTPQPYAEVSLRDFRNDGIQSPQYLELPLFKEGYEVMVGKQNFFVFTVEPESKLVMSFTYGAQLSNEQDLKRTIKRAGKSLDVLNGSRKGC